MARYSNDTVIILDTNGKPIVGAYTYFYEPGGTTLKSIYSDDALTISQANPVRSLAGGILPEIFIDGLYAVKQNDADDVALYPTQDPVGEIIAGQFEAYNSADTYAVNEIVLATNGSYYISLVSSNQGNEPSVSVSQWQVIPVKDMVGLTDAQTLTNKTLTNPTVTAGTFTSPDIDQVVDSSGNEVVIFGEVASAINEITVTNAAIGTDPIISPSGDDTDIGENHVMKGDGLFQIGGTGLNHAGKGYGGAVLISTATASASATVDFSALLDGTYKKYIVEVVNAIPATNTDQLFIRIQTAGTTWETGSVYTDAGSATLKTAITVSAATSSTVAHGGVSCEATISDPSNAATDTIITTDGLYSSSTTVSVASLVSGGRYEAVTAVTGIRFYFSTGDVASGEFRLFGVIV